MKRQDKLDSEISRRDFVNGVLIASSGLVSLPAAALAGQPQQAAGAACGDAVGDDPRLGRGGNSPSIFNIGHWMRDQRLTFGPGVVNLAPGCDGHEGRFPIVDDGAESDVLIAGGGLAGMSSAFYLARKRPGLKIHLLESNRVVGGNAACDDQPPLPVRASTCGAHTAMPDSAHLKEIYRETGVDWNSHVLETPIDAYFFDEYTPGVKNGYAGWQIDMLKLLGAGRSKEIVSPPYDDKVMADLARCVRTLKDWGDKEGAPNEPPELSNPKYDYLAKMSFASYLTEVLHCDPRVVDFYTAYTVDCMGGTPHHVNAHTVISFLGSDYTGEIFAYPGGTWQIAAQIHQWLTAPGADGQAPPRATIQTEAVALRVEANTVSSHGKASIIYYKDGKFRRATANAVIVASQVQSARRMVAHLLDEERKAAWEDFNSAPAIVANVAVRNMAPFLSLGLGYSNYWWGGKYWSNLLVADWMTERRQNPDRQSVLTFYSHVTVPPEEFAAERIKLLTTPFSEYENSLRDDLSRMLRETGFDFQRDVSAIFIYRWGHSMILPTTRSVFGNSHDANGQLIRDKAPRRVACRPLGPISFAGQYTEGSPSVESAIGSGHRAALEVLSRL